MDQTPETSKPKSKKKWFWIGGALLLIFIIAAAGGGDNAPKDQGAENQNVQANTPQTPEQELEAAVRAIFPEKNNMDRPGVKKIVIASNSSGSFFADVEFNADDNLTTNLRKGRIETKISEVYTTLYTSGKPVAEAKVTAFFPLMDQYGNESDGQVYATRLAKAEADKINWNAEKLTLQKTILPGVWTTTFLHPEFR